MTETNEITYQALVTIILPGDQQASAHVTLTPPDMIETDGKIKALHECTLAELQGFADQLENDVWDIYQSINLLELDDNDQIHVEITVLGKQGQRLMPLQNWYKQLNKYLL